MTQKTRDAIAAYLFLLPFILTLSVFFVYAFINAILYSFTNYNLFNLDQLEFVGFRNYVNLFNEANFLRALRNTITFSLVVTAVQTVGALVMASVLNARVRGLGFFRAAYYIPCVASSVVISLIFLWLFQRRGLINYLATQVQAYLPQIGVFVVLLLVAQAVQVALERRQNFPVRPYDPALFVVSFLVAAAATGLLTVTGVVAAREVTPIDTVWLQTRQQFPAQGGPAVPLIVIMMQNVFTTIPTLMLLFLAALQDVPKSYYEAAALDGANAVQQFRFVTIPSVRPVTFLVVTLGLIGTLQMFDQVAIFGDAVPLESVITLAYFVYDRMFPGARLPEVGLASAAALFLALLTLSIVLVQRLFISSEAN